MPIPYTPEADEGSSLQYLIWLLRAVGSGAPGPTGNTGPQGPTGAPGASEWRAVTLHLAADSSPHVLATLAMPPAPGMTHIEVRWMCRAEGATGTIAADSGAGTVQASYYNLGGTATRLGADAVVSHFAAGVSPAVTTSPTGAIVEINTVGTGDDADWTLEILQFNSAL